MSLGSLDARNHALAEKIAHKLSIRGADLRAKMRKAGRRLPRRLRREGAYLIEAAQMEGHPKLSRQIDLPRVSRAYQEFDRYLDKIDPADLWWGRFLGILGEVAFHLLLFAGLLVAFFAWRGDLGFG